MEPQTTTEVTKDPYWELQNLKLSVMMFCHQMEMCYIITPLGASKDILKIQMDSEYYKQMKSKISTEPVHTREEVESTEISNL